ncbi:hypothetical protein E4L95_17820 [Paracoccus liaowanqingii]|uniref:Uncharacterized protein n=1 Tax=Paracoccus liaowanqingii TaxID=2560053 RepID=A0A4Z1BWP8_9RHOB|nr:hypothetical protein E4L95_17820 [Paracoccus liaowanqingii]
MSDAVRTQGSRCGNEVLHGRVVLNHGYPIIAADQFHVGAAGRPGRKAYDVLHADGNERTGVTFCDFDKHGGAPRSGFSDLRRASSKGQAVYVFQPKVIVDGDDLSNA